MLDEQPFSLGSWVAAITADFQFCQGPELIGIFQHEG
jgi:hypothetical protein